LFSYQHIDEYQIEITSYCNAACPQCPRNYNGQGIKQNQVPFKTTLITLDRLDTPLSRSRSTWTGNGIDLQQVSDFIKYSLNTNPNTCVEEITFYCNLNYKA